MHEDLVAGDVAAERGVEGSRFRAAVEDEDAVLRRALSFEGHALERMDVAGVEMHALDEGLEDIVRDVVEDREERRVVDEQRLGAGQQVQPRGRVGGIVRGGDQLLVLRRGPAGGIRSLSSVKSSRNASGSEYSPM